MQLDFLTGFLCFATTEKYINWCNVMEHHDNLLIRIYQSLEANKDTLDHRF